MLINDLPDELLIAIFDHVNKMKQLIEISKVCSRWHQLILHRFSKITYIPSKMRILKSKRGKVLMENSAELKGLNLNYWFPALRIVDFTRHKTVMSKSGIPVGITMDRNDAAKIIHNTPTIKGMIISGAPEPTEDQPVRRFENIEMVSSKFINDHFGRYFNPVKLTQLHLSWCRWLDIYRVAMYFTNLTRFHFNVKTERLYAGPKFSKLKILEFGAYCDNNRTVYPGYLFMDYCPSLEHAFFNTETNNYLDCINESVKNLNMKSLVIYNEDRKFRQKWSSIKSLLSKFPNLENLAIRENNKISDEHIPQLVQLLPKLRILDFRDYSFRVTSKSADYLAKYCQESGRSIVIYYAIQDEDASDPADWPKINETISWVCNGFDFVKNCFYKTFIYLPSLMDD